ncbi:MAG: glycosyltransferase family 4 protein [Candidatus Kapaibacterium sp.]
MKFDHIIITTQDFPPSTGGIQTWCVQLAKQFADRDINVTILTKSFDDFEEEPFAYHNINVIRLPHHKWTKEKNILCYKELKNIVTPTTIVLASNWKMGVPAYIYNIFRSVPYFTVCHGLDAYESRWKNSVLQHATFKRSQISIAVSQFTKNYMIESGTKSEIAVINNGVEDGRYFKTEVPEVILDKYKFDNSKLNILNIGRLVERKGYDYTIEAIAELPNVVFHIGGTGEIEKDLKRIAEKHGVTDRVHFHGFIPDDEINYLFNAADLFVMPSRKVGRSVEGFGITYLEAAAAGTPSIGGKNSGAADAIEDGKSGLLVDSDSVGSIREGIKYFIDKPEQLVIMSNYAALRTKEFTWSKVADCMLDLFNSKLK